MVFYTFRELNRLFAPRLIAIEGDFEDNEVMSDRDQFRFRCLRNRMHWWPAVMRSVRLNKSGCPDCARIANRARILCINASRRRRPE